MKVLGMDTATNRVHWVTNFGMYGSYYCTTKDPDINRIELALYCKKLFRSDLPADIHVFCEEPLALSVNGKTTRLLGLAAGSIFATHALFAGGYWHWVDQSTWKKSVLGRGVRPKGWGEEFPKARREKEWIMSAVQQDAMFITGASPELKRACVLEEDLHDAWAICEYGQQYIEKLV